MSRASQAEEERWIESESGNENRRCYADEGAVSKLSSAALVGNPQRGQPKLMQHSSQVFARHQMQIANPSRPQSSDFSKTDRGWVSSPWASTMDSRSWSDLVLLTPQLFHWPHSDPLTAFAAAGYISRHWH